MPEVNVCAGICGFNSRVKVDCENLKDAIIDFTTECPDLKPMEKELKKADAFAECFAKVGNSPIFEMARAYCKHAACPVPTAIIKAIEVACGLALPSNVEMKISI